MQKIYYWLDLLTDGKPSHTKLLTLLTQLVLLVGVIKFGTAAQGVTTGFLLYVLIVAVAPFGLQGYKTLLKLKFGSLDTSMLESEKARAQVLQAQAAVIAARRSGSEQQATEPAP